MKSTSATEGRLEVTISRRSPLPRKVNQTMYYYDEVEIEFKPAKDLIG